MTLHANQIYNDIPDPINASQRARGLHILCNQSVRPPLLPSHSSPCSLTYQNPWKSDDSLDLPLSLRATPSGPHGNGSVVAVGSVLAGLQRRNRLPA